MRKPFGVTPGRLFRRGQSSSALWVFDHPAAPVAACRPCQPLQNWRMIQLALRPTVIGGVNEARRHSGKAWERFYHL